MLSPVPVASVSLPPGQSGQDQHAHQLESDTSRSLSVVFFCKDAVFVVDDVTREISSVCLLVDIWFPSTCQFVLTQPTTEDSGHGPAQVAGCRGRGDEQLGSCLQGRPGVIHVLKEKIIIWIQAGHRAVSP